MAGSSGEHAGMGGPGATTAPSNRRAYRCSATLTQRLAGHRLAITSRPGSASIEAARPPPCGTIDVRLNN